MQILGVFIGMYFMDTKLTRRSLLQIGGIGQAVFLVRGPGETEGAHAQPTRIGCSAGSSPPCPSTRTLTPPFAPCSPLSAHRLAPPFSLPPGGGAALR